MIRRSFFLLSATVLFATTTTGGADAALKSSHYAVGNFELSLDGLPPTFVSSVDGGTMVSEAVVESGARGNFVKKRPGAPRFEPLVVSVSATQLPSKWFDWLNGALAGADTRKNGNIGIFDVNLKEQQRRSFTGLRLAEFALSKLDAKDAKKPVEVELSFVGDSTTETKGTGQLATVAATGKAKNVTSAQFRVSIPGLETSRVTSVSEISIKLAGGGTPTKGTDAMLRREAARAEIAPFSVRLADFNADSWRTWHNNFVVKGASSDADEKQMTIELLDPTLQNVLFRIKLDGVGIVGLARSSPMETGSQTATELQADLYAESFRIEAVAPGGK